MIDDLSLSDNLTSIVNSVRLLLEAPLVSASYIGFAQFPQGACSDPSCLLGIILEEKGLGSWELLQGIHNKRTHGWLVQDTTIIDITADQFDRSIQNLIIQNHILTIPYLGFEVSARYPVQDYNKGIHDFNYHVVLQKIRKFCLSTPFR